MTTIDNQELKDLYFSAKRYESREGMLDVRPDLFTFSHHQEWADGEIRRLQLLVHRLSITLVDALAPDQDEVAFWKSSQGGYKPQ